ncbi:MAG: hypothetical protein GX303_03740, partial [Clostridiales bacterium]|nr:hypothetical protein [Clostridiales bacterium]
IYTNFKSAADYLIMMQLLRLFLIIYSVVTGIESVTATGILVSGLIFDYAVVMVFAFEKPLYKPSVKKGEQTPQEQRKLSSVTLSVVLIALLWSVIVIALPLAFRGTEIFSSDREVESYAFVALLFAQLLLVFVNRTGWRDADSRLQISPMLIGYCGAIIAFIACAVLVPSFGMLFGVFELGAVSFILALCPSIVMIAAFMIDRRLRRGGKQ